MAWAAVPRCAHPSPGLPRGSCLEPATAPGTRPHWGSAAPHSLKGIYPPAGRGGQRARVDLRSRPGRAVRLAHIAAAPPQAPQCGHRRAQRGPSTEHGGERRGAARPPPMHEGPQRRAQCRSQGRRRRRAAARIVQSATRAPEPGPGLSTAGAEGTITRPPPPLPPPRRRCRWRAAPSPLAPSVKSSVLCLAAAIVRRGPVPCLGRQPRETEGPRGVSGCGPAGSALRRGRPGVGGGRGGGERPGEQGAGPTRLLEEEAKQGRLQPRTWRAGCEASLMVETRAPAPWRASPMAAPCAKALARLSRHSPSVRRSPQV